MHLFPRRDLVKQLCRTSGRWLIADREGDHYWIATNDGRARRLIDVRSSDKYAFIKFNAVFPVRFSLERTPSGLFARLLLRSNALVYSSWLVSIWDSCEATTYLHAIMPTSAMDARLFDAICTEMDGEIRGFHTELNDKFSYGIGRPAAGHGGYSQDVPDIRFVEPAPENISQQIRARVINGPKHLPNG
jgi:hypothetical protein